VVERIQNRPSSNTATAIDWPVAAGEFHPFTLDTSGLAGSSGPRRERSHPLSDGIGGSRHDDGGLVWRGLGLGSFWTGPAADRVLTDLTGLASFVRPCGGAGSGN